MNVARCASTLMIALALTGPALAQTPLPEDATHAGTPTAEPTPAEQQPPPGQPIPADPAAVPPVTEANRPNVFKLVAGDFKHFFSKDTAHVLGFFAVAGAATAPWDREGVNNGFNIPTSLFEAGNIAGNFVFQAGAGFATYGTARLLGKKKAADAGRDIVRAQILSQVLVQALKVTIRRERPDASNSASFPSGHAASAFATAGVLHRYYGWKLGAPAYAFGSYVALARLAWNRHHATDVVMGAGMGLASARTVTIRVAGSRFGVGVQPQPGGASLNFTKIYK